MTLSVALWSVYLFGILFLLIAVAREDLKRDTLRADNLICGIFLFALWPVLVASVALLTGFYIAVWLFTPTIRNRVSLKTGISDFWS